MEVPDGTFDSLNAGLERMLKSAGDVGKKLNPSFKPDEGYPRTDPVQKAGVQGLALANTLDALTKTADEAITKRAAVEAELKDAHEMIAQLSSDNAHLLKGERPCVECEATGKADGKDHATCKGTGWIPRPAPVAKK